MRRGRGRVVRDLPEGHTWMPCVEEQVIHLVLFGPYGWRYHTRCEDRVDPPYVLPEVAPGLKRPCPPCFGTTTP